MIPFDRLNRRLHLYLGLFFLPWLFIYGVSSALISHAAWFRNNQEPPWQVLFERDYERAVPDKADLRQVAQEILKDLNLEGAFWAQRPNPRELRINRFSFWDLTRLTYSIPERRLRAEHQTLRWDQVILRMHFRGGFQQPTFRDDLWAILVDLACLGILVWVGSGIYMWWRLPRIRLWGALALGAGGVSFLALILSL